MHSMERSGREDRLRRDGRNPSLSSTLPSFSSSLLDEIYRSIDGGDDNCEDLKLYKDRVAKKQSNGTGVKKAKVSSGTIKDEEMASLRRACLVEKWMEKKVTDKVSGQPRQSLSEECNRKTKHRESDPLFFSSSSTSSDTSSGGFSSSEGEFLGMPKSRTSCFRTQKPKPVRTSVSGVSQKLGKASYYEQSECYLFHDYRQNPEDLKPEQGLMKSKLRALNIYSNLKKVKQPISPGGKLASFLNSLFTNGNTKKTKNSCSAIGGSEDPCVERKSKSTQASTCSSASSYTRSCLTKSSLNSKDKSSNGVKRTVRFFPVSVIVDEDCRPCGHKCINGGNSGEFGTRNKEEMNHVLVENRRKIEEAAREILRKEYGKNGLAMGRDQNAEYEEDEDNDAASDSSSDLFELDHLAFIGKNSDRYSEELPVYETTHLHANRAIANGLIC